jgi:heptosyltransferase I
VLLTGLGDVVHGLPIACAIRRAWPASRITWVVESMPAGLIEHHPAIDRVVVFHKQEGFAGVLDLRRQLRGEHPDVSLNLNVYFKSVLPVLLSRAPRRIGFDRGRARDGVWLTANEHLPVRPRAHTLDMFLEFLDVLGVAAQPLEWRLEPTPLERAEQAAFFGPLDRPAVAIVTASANPKKDWPVDRYVGLTERLHGELGLRPILIGGPGSRENEAARTIVQQSRAPVIDARGDGVRRLIWLIGGSRLTIAPDTGPVHISRALRVPVVGLFGHTNPWRVGPYRMFEDLWIDRYTDAGESPDPSRFDPRHGRMEQITIDDVMAKVVLALSREPSC